jgi:glycogen(starch) synthase
VQRILMTADAVGGVWSYAVDLCRAFGRHNIAVTLAVLGPAPRRSQRAMLDGLDHVDLVTRECRLEWMDDPWSDVDAAGEWLLALADRIGADLVHLNGYAHASLPWDRPVLVVGHSCVLSWWVAVHGTEAPPAWDEYAARVGRGLHAADLVVAPSAAMLDALLRHYGPLPRTAVIPNGLESPAGGASAPKEPFVFSAGRLWDAAKNIDMITSAASDVSWPVCIAGEGRDADPPAPNVHWLGWLPPDDLSEWLQRASIFALPARYEPFGLSALEAAQAGCALVLGDIPSQREIWGDAALFVPPDNRPALVHAIQSLIDEPQRRTAMATRASRRAATFTTTRTADSYFDAYRALLSLAAV